MKGLNPKRNTIRREAKLDRHLIYSLVSDANFFPFSKPMNPLASERRKNDNSTACKSFRTASDRSRTRSLKALLEHHSQDAWVIMDPRVIITPKRLMVAKIAIKAFGVKPAVKSAPLVLTPSIWHNTITISARKASDNTAETSSGSHERGIL